MTTPKDETFILNLPAGSKDKYETAIAVIPQDMRTYWRYHRVDYGDTLPAWPANITPRPRRLRRPTTSRTAI
jgi:hypothetical protein